MAKTMKTRKPLTARHKGLIALVLLLALTVFVSCLAVGGMKLDKEGVNILMPWVPVSAENWPDSLPLDRTLGGGLYAEYTASAAEGEDLAAKVKEAAEVIETRLSMRTADAKVTVIGENTLRIELPDMKQKDADAIFAMAVAPAKFTFAFDDGVVFMTEEDIANAGVGYADNTGTSYSVGLTTTEEGKQKLADATSAHIGSNLTLSRDGVALVSATVPMAFTDGAISVPLGLDYAGTVEAAIQINSGSFDVTFASASSGELANDGVGALRIVLIVAAVLLAAALVYVIVTGKLTGISAIWTVWCAVMLEMFFFATVVLAYTNVANVIALLLGILLAIYTAVNRTAAIAKEIAEGNGPKSATKVGFRAAAKQVWMAHGALLVVSLILMIFSATKYFGYTLCAGVVASAMVAPLMRAFQACFVSISGKAKLFGKVK